MRFSAYWLALPLAAAGFGQPSEKRLELKDLVAEALGRNPEILTAQKRYEAAGQRPAQVRSLPDPMLSLGWNATGNPLPGAGLGVDPVANIGFMASQQFPYPGKLRLKGEVAMKDAEAEAQEYRAATLAVLARVKESFYKLHHAYVEGEVLERNRDLLRSLLRATEARYAAGTSTQADVFRAQTQITVVETRLIQLEQERRVRQGEINSLLNRPLDTGIAQPAEPHEPELNITERELIEKARTAAPLLARNQKKIEGAGTAIELARKDYYPDLTLNGGFYSMGSMGPMYVVRADLNLPLRRARTRAAIAEKSHELAGAKSSYEAGARSLEYQIHEQYLTAETAQRLAGLYLNTVLPQARLTEESALSAYASGAGDFASLLANYVAAIDYEMSYHEQVQQFHLALVHLEEITGVELIP